MKESLKRDLIHALLSVMGMVTIMLTYNVLLEVGFSTEAMLAIFRRMIPLFIVAFIVQKFVVSPLVRNTHKRIFPVVILVSQA